MNTNSSEKRIGRPPKKSYDAQKQFHELLETVDYVYSVTGEIKATATELGMNPIKIKKLLITCGTLKYDETRQIERLMSYGKKFSEVQKELNLKKSSINSYLPYSKIPYKETEISANADRCELYRKRKRAVENIHDRDSFKECIKLFQNYSFYTEDGEKFSYEISGNKLFVNQGLIKVPFEIVIKVYEKIMQGEKLDDEERVGSYLMPIFQRLGLVSATVVNLETT